MPHHCCVPLCTSDSRLQSCEGLSFHSFPNDTEVRKRWIICIRRDIGPDFRITKGTRVCSKHFQQEDYIPSSTYRVRQRLKKNAEPSIFNWTSEKPLRRKLFRQTPQRLELPSKIKCVESVCTDEVPIFDHTYSQDSVYDEQDQTEDSAPQDDPHNKSSGSDDSLINVEPAPSPDKYNLLQLNKKLLQLRNEEKFTLLRFCAKDSDIKYYTGFQSYESLNCFYQFLTPECNFLYYVGTENTSHGTPYELLNKRGPSRTLSPMEELFITLVRLRKGLPEKLISDLYNLSEGHISKIINTWILFLADRLRCIPIWQSKEHVKATMPSFFREHYPTTRAIVDCTEMFIEHPSAADCQRETFSTYKHHNTAKGLISISPDGQINFISPLYAGRVSDKKIIRHCGFLDLIEEGDGVMVDRGFDIEEDLVKRGASLIMPSFLSGADQFTSDQLQSSRTIAAVRVHVERAVRKVKEFEILGNTIPISMCPMLEKIWMICGHLANFTGSLFSNK